MVIGQRSAEQVIVGHEIRHFHLRVIAVAEHDHKNAVAHCYAVSVTLNAVKASRTGEKSSVLRSVFPKREYLQSRYPYLKKRPYLLPVAWAQRIAHYTAETQSDSENSASGSLKLAKERIELMRQYDVID